MNSKQLVLAQFAKSLRTKRLDKGITQEELAYRAGLDRSYVGGVERGERNVSLVNLVKLAGALEIPLSELVADIES